MTSGTNYLTKKIVPMAWDTKCSTIKSSANSLERQVFDDNGGANSLGRQISDKIEVPMASGTNYSTKKIVPMA